MIRETIVGMSMFSPNLHLWGMVPSRGPPCPASLRVDASTLPLRRVEVLLEPLFLSNVKTTLPLKNLDTQVCTHLVSLIRELCFRGTLNDELLTTAATRMFMMSEDNVHRLTKTGMLTSTIRTVNTSPLITRSRRDDVEALATKRVRPQSMPIPSELGRQ